MRKELLVTVSTLALLASVELSSAQDKGGVGSGGAGAPAAQQPGAPPNAGARPESPSQPSEQLRQKDERGNRAQGAPTKENQAQQPGGKPEQRNTQQSQDRDQPNKRDQQTQDRQQPDRRDQQTQDRANPRKDSTTGQGAAGSAGGASLTSEQRTKISTTIKQSNVRPVTNVNFNIAVGTVVPRDVTLHPLPPAVVEIYPEWRPYRFILVRDEIIVIDPATHRIVAVIEA